MLCSWWRHACALKEHQPTCRLFLPPIQTVGFLIVRTLQCVSTKFDFFSLLLYEREQLSQRNRDIWPLELTLNCEFWVWSGPECIKAISVSFQKTVGDMRLCSCRRLCLHLSIGRVPCQLQSVSRAWYSSWRPSLLGAWPPRESDLSFLSLLFGCADNCTSEHLFPLSPRNQP